VQLKSWFCLQPGTTSAVKAAAVWRISLRLESAPGERNDFMTLRA